MPDIATHADCLQFTSGGSEVVSLDAVGVLDGVRVLQAAGSNGPGMGRLIGSEDGNRLAWQAPGSSAAGPSVEASADGSYLLEDGDNPDAFLRVQVYADYRPDGADAARVYLGDVYENAVSNDDVTAGEASAGDVTTWTLTLENAGNTVLSQLRVWVDSAISRIEISDDGASWVSPTSEAAALVLPDLAVGGTDTLHIRRTVAASTSSDPSELAHLHYSFHGI